MAAQKISSSSSLAQVVVKHHDVFLSFRGEDTRNTFTSHLYYTLREKGVQAFIDDELIRGEEIATSLIETIQQSKISIVVFSENYASSPWCLDELVNIMESRNSLGQLVWPIFFNVDPSHVRNHDVKGSFGEALAKYEAESTDKYKEKLPKWKIALNKAASISGWHLTNGNESQLIQRVVEAALSKLNRTPLYIAKYPVGIENRLEDLGSLMNLGVNGVRVIGIYGLGGIGKTTISKAVFNKFADDFEGSSFLANVREMSKQYCGLVKLQETLLFDILGDKNLKVGNIHRGINIIRERLRYKRVLIVLDDVDHLDQLETLVGAHDWFGSRSRIIITTRYKHFLTVHGANDTYKVGGLRYDQALELLRHNAFNGDKAVKGYHELSKRVVGYANGIPLALNVLGSFLCDKDEDEWKSAIKNLERKPNKEIYAMLKISYDALQDNEKAIFLDIACFFVGEDKDYVSEILESFNFCSTIGIRVLIDMSLITIESGKVRMHNLIQEMGWEIVRQESAEIDKRSRLWLPKDVFHVFWEKMGTNAIEGIKLHLPRAETLELSAKAFKNMKRLRLLIFDKVYLSTTIEDLPNELQFIKWPGYQFPTLPFSSGRKQLVILNMPRSRIEQLGEGFKNFENLKSVNLSSSEFLTKIPDLSTAPNIESLYLDHCTNLVEIHESIGSLIRLVTLDLQFCLNLRIFPSTLRAKDLRKLNFKGCSSLARLPNIVVEMKNLKVLCLSGTAIKKLPDLSRVQNLESLDLDHCKNLVEVHESVGSLTSLQTLSLQFCCNLRILPRCLRSKCLGALNLTNCYSLEKFPDILLEMQILRSLYLSGSAIKELPPSIEHLVSLRTLNLVSCRKLEHIPSSIYKLHQLEWLSLRDCSNLCKFPKNISSSTCNVTFPSSELLPVASQMAPNSSLNFPLPMLKLLDLQNCNLSKADFLATPNGFHSLLHLYLGENKFVNLPSIDRIPKLWYVNLNGCKFLRKIPELPRNLSYLYASDCKSLLDAQGKIMAKIKRNKDSEIQVIYPRHYIPQWFSHKCVGDSVAFIFLHSNEWKEYSGVIICGVFEVDCKAVKFSLELVGDTLPASQRVQSQRVYPTASLYRSIPSAKSGDMWLHYLPTTTCPKLMTGYIYKLSFSALEKASAKFISRCGVHILWGEDDINSAELFAGNGNLEDLNRRRSKHPRNVHILSDL